MNEWDKRKMPAGDVMQMAEWVGQLAEWQVIAHLTWKDWLDKDGVPHGITVGGASRSFERFMRKELPRVSYFYAVEPNPSREGSHVHALWADCHDLQTQLKGTKRYVRSMRGGDGVTDAWQLWFNRFGRATIEPVRSQRDVTDYCGKHLVAASYTTKQAVWWNVKLQWHRVRAVNGSEFVLDAVFSPHHPITPTSSNVVLGHPDAKFSAGDDQKLAIAGFASLPAQAWRQTSPGVFVRS